MFYAQLVSFVTRCCGHRLGEILAGQTARDKVARRSVNDKVWDEDRDKVWDKVWRGTDGNRAVRIAGCSAAPALVEEGRDWPSRIAAMLGSLSKTVGDDT